MPGPALAALALIALAAACSADLDQPLGPPLMLEAPGEASPLQPPDPAFPPDPCSGGQSLVLVQARYTDVAIADVTNGIRKPVPGTFCRTFFDNAYPPEPC